MIELKTISRIVFFVITLVLLFGCTFSNKNSKYELYFQNANKLGYMKIYDKFDISEIKYVDYNNTFRLGTSDTAINNEGVLYHAICKNLNMGTLLKKIYMVKGDMKIGELDTPEVCPESLFIDNNILYIFYISIFKGTRPDGGLLTVIDTNTNEVIDNKWVFGSLDRKPKIYKDKIYLYIK